MTAKRILVVDDERLNLKIIRAILEGAAFQLDMAENGAIAWERLNREGNHYDLMILDRMMPVLDGMALLERMKAEPRFRALPVIMQSAANTPQQVAEGLAAGAYYYLTKPYEPDSLLAIVRAALEEQGQREDLARAARECEALRPLLVNAEFQFRDLAEAYILAAQLAQHCPAPEIAAIGLGELLVNAVEHGNLEISYAEKSQLKWEDGWEDEIARRLELPEYRHRRVSVRMERYTTELVFTVSDQGHGFDWNDYLDFSPERAFDPNGRGIAMARQMSFSGLEFQGNGSTVVARVARG